MVLVNQRLGKKSSNRSVCSRILDESARWLMAKQKYGASQCIIDKIAKMNKRKSPQDSGNVLLEERSDRQKVGRTEQVIILLVFMYFSVLLSTSGIVIYNFNYFMT